jgi:hypothetical protein
MQTLDNATAHPASEYDQNVRKTIPYRDNLHEAAINLMRSANPIPHSALIPAAELVRSSKEPIPNSLIRDSFLLALQLQCSELQLTG